MKRLLRQRTTGSTGISAAMALVWITSALASEPVITKTWAEKMRTLEQQLQTLLLDVSSEARFNDPKNATRIETSVKAFSKSIHDLKAPRTTLPDADPTIALLAGEFSKEADRAYKALKLGNRAYARDILLSTTHYCIACHTRNTSGPSFQTTTTSDAVKALQPLEQANFYASTRQFDRALETYESLLGTAVGTRPFDWERAARSSLAIAVRVKRDPDRALSIANRVLATPQVAFYFQQEATQWKKSLQAWKAESAPKTQSAEEIHAQAVKWIAEAKALQKFPTDRSADILYLRASSAIHDLLSLAPDGPHAAEGLYLAGLCYEVLRDMALVDRHEHYYHACILKSPHSDTAQRCFERYESSVYRGYTGSGGVHLPMDVRAKLHELMTLSLPR